MIAAVRRVMTKENWQGSQEAERITELRCAQPRACDFTVRARIHFSVPTAANAATPTARMCSQASTSMGAVWKRRFMNGA